MRIHRGLVPYRRLRADEKSHREPIWEATGRYMLRGLSAVSDSPSVRFGIERDRASRTLCVGSAGGAAVSLVLSRHCCPACGYPGLEASAYARLGPPPWIHPGPPPYERWYGEPSYEVCPCCGFEAGNDDDSWGGTVRALSFEEYLREWAAAGASWLDDSLRPKVWDLEGQLRRAGIVLDPTDRERSDGRGH